MRLLCFTRYLFPSTFTRTFIPSTSVPHSLPRSPLLSSSPPTPPLLFHTRHRLHRPTLFSLSPLLAHPPTFSGLLRSHCTLYFLALIFHPSLFDLPFVFSSQHTTSAHTPELVVPNCQVSPPPCTLSYTMSARLSFATRHLHHP